MSRTLNSLSQISNAQARTQALLVRACTKFQAIIRRLRVEEALNRFHTRWDYIKSHDDRPAMWLDRITMQVLLAQWTLPLQYQYSGAFA